MKRRISMSSQREVGKLIVFEGVDRVGKSTLTQGLVDRLNGLGILSEYATFPGTRPGTIGRVVYDIHHNHAGIGIEKPSSTALQALHIAAHLDAIERFILPALDQGRWVLLDRFWWSTRAYGRASGADPSILDAMIHVERLQWRGAEPDMLFLIERKESTDDSMLHREYRALYEAERGKYPVCILRNDSSVDDSISNALTVLDERFDTSKVVAGTP